MLNLQITSDINPTGLEKRFAEDLLLKELKNKLVLITGVETGSMLIELHVDNQLKGELTNDEQSIGDAVGEANAAKQLRLHVVDKSGTSASLLDDGQEVKKFEMSDEAYEKRENSLRNFKKQNKLGRFGATNGDAVKED